MTKQLMEDLKEYLLEIDSDEGRELIKTSRKVDELWWDSEITSTKAGKLYGRRSALHISYRFIPENEFLWDREEEGSRKLITDLDAVVEAIRKHYPDFTSPYLEGMEYLSNFENSLLNEG